MPYPSKGRAGVQRNPEKRAGESNNPGGRKGRKRGRREKKGKREKGGEERRKREEREACKTDGAKITDPGNPGASKHSAFRLIKN